MSDEKPIEQIDISSLTTSQLKALIDTLHHEVTDRGLTKIRLQSLNEARKHLLALIAKIDPVVDAARALDYNYGSHGLSKVEGAAFELQQVAKQTLAKLEEQIEKLERTQHLNE